MPPCDRRRRSIRPAQSRVPREPRGLSRRYRRRHPRAPATVLALPCNDKARRDQHREKTGEPKTATLPTEGPADSNGDYSQLSCGQLTPDRAPSDRLPARDSRARRQWAPDYGVQHSRDRGQKKRGLDSKEAPLPGVDLSLAASWSDRRFATCFDSYIAKAVTDHAAAGRLLLPDRHAQLSAAVRRTRPVKVHDVARGIRAEMMFQSADRFQRADQRLFTLVITSRARSNPKRRCRQPEGCWLVPP